MAPRFALTLRRLESVDILVHDVADCRIESVRLEVKI